MVKLKNIHTNITGRAKDADPYTRTLYMFNAVSLVGGTIYGLYYGIFLYKNTFSLSVLAIDGLLGGVGAWLGYVIGIFAIKRFGYRASIRVTIGMWTAIALVTALIAGHIAEWFMLIAVVKSLPAGIFLAVTDTIMLRDVRTKARNGMLQLILAMEFIASIILPSAIGAVISYSGGFEWAFLTAGFVYAAALLLPCRLPSPDVSFNLKDMLRILKRPLYKHHAFNRTASAGFNQLNAFALTIIPFLLLENELSVGLIASLSALVAAMIALGSRRIKQQHHLRLGYSAYAIRSLAALSFVMFWTAPLMVVWQLIGKLVTPFHDPLQKSIDIHNDSLIMGRDAKKKALEINVLNNTLVLIGTTIAFGGFLLITGTGTSEQQAILQTLILVYAVWRFINLAISSKINKWAMDPIHIPVRSRLRRRLGFLITG